MPTSSEERSADPRDASKQRGESKQSCSIFLLPFLSSSSFPPHPLSHTPLDRFFSLVHRRRQHAPRRVLLRAPPPRRPARVASVAVHRRIGSSAGPPDADPSRSAVRLQVSFFRSVFVFVFVFFRRRRRRRPSSTSSRPLSRFSAPLPPLFLPLKPPEKPRQQQQQQ